MNIVDGKNISKKILDKIKKEITTFSKPPVLAAILVGNDPASSLYIKIKEKKCQEIGIVFKKIFLPEDVDQENLLSIIKKLNSDKKISAIIVQLPLPKQFDTKKIINSVNIEKDADALNEKSKLMPPTVGSILEIFDYYGISLKNKKICLVGYGRLVGEPLKKEMDKLGLNIDVCTNKTENLAKHTKKADVLISATGVPHLITIDMVKNNAIVIDAGTAIEKSADKKSQIMGDVDFDNVSKIASLITPSSGGVGPITVAKLLENVVKLFKKEHK
jgi:methylenetetrahydrofolate dehydrogenase (NADP+)/methenyltetrahydrofolate cyclohydrolase